MGGDNQSDIVLSDKYFGFEMDGQTYHAVSVEPGDYTITYENSTMGNRPDNCMQFKPGAVQYGSWTVTKYAEAGDTRLKDLFEAFAKGQRKVDLAATGSLIYKDEAGAEKRRINFMGFLPTSYDYVNVDARNSGSAATETISFGVTKCQYQ